MTGSFLLLTASEVITFTLATRCIIAAWCLTAVVFVNSYTSSLVSYLMAPKFVPLINTVKNLADSHDISIVVLKHTSVESILFVGRNIFSIMSIMAIFKPDVIDRTQHLVR